MTTTRLADYQPSEFFITHTDFDFDLDEEKTMLTSTLQIKRSDPNALTPLVLDGGDCTLQSVAVNGRVLESDEYEVKNNQLIVLDTPAKNFSMQIVTTINPTANTKLEGLYKSGDILTTHNEAQGFRNMTYYLDRPDVLGTFTTKITADKAKYPVLLSNGNLDTTGCGVDPANPNRHYVTYKNPIPIPSYLYAMVAGNLALREDVFVTKSGRKVALKIFVPAVDHPKTEHAMNALKAAMKFDEERYNREYDLDIYNVVGVPSFNAGAMENKGLNIFNNSSLLADPEISTDDDYEWVYGTVGHEYFHNWRGNRVTVKNWFQLSLKEGFASVTEQEFSQSVFSSMVPRIGEIQVLLNRQFKEDAGPMSHAVLPGEYTEPDNIYTTTIYRKGAELINMLRTLIGNEAYKRGCDIYFAEHDGKAANIEDFLKAMETASQRDLSQFFRWYTQAGTPEVEIDENYNAATGHYSLTFRQSCPPTPGQVDKEPLLIPIATTLYDSQGNALPLQLVSDDEPSLLPGDEKPAVTTCLLELTEAEQTFTFAGIAEMPIPSLFRNFSAPVKVTSTPIGTEENIFLLEHDTDPVNRWFAAQNIVKDAIKEIITDLSNGETPSVDPTVIAAFQAALRDPRIEPRLKSQLINFPKVDAFFDFMKPANPDVINAARECFIDAFITGCYDDLKAIYQTLAATPMSAGYDPESASLRKLKNMCLSFMVQSFRSEAIDLCLAQLASAVNMTDRKGAIEPLVTVYNPARVDLRQVELDKFIARWKDEPLVLEHIMNLYAYNDAPDAVEQLRELFNSPIFNKEIPSHTFESLYRFYQNNVRFHDPSGKGYELIADCIVVLDKINPSTAAAIAGAFGNWKALETNRQGKMLEQLFRLEKLELSSNVKELIGKSVKEAREIQMQRSPRVNANPFVFFQGAEQGEFVEVALDDFMFEESSPRLS